MIYKMCCSGKVPAEKTISAEQRVGLKGLRIES